VRKLWLAALCSAGVMVGGQAASAVVTFDDLATGLVYGHIMSGGLVVFGSYPGAFQVIAASDPAATGASGQEALTLLNPGAGYVFVITGDAFYSSLDLNGAAGGTLNFHAFASGGEITDSIVLDNNPGAFQTYLIPTAFGSIVSIGISSDSEAFTVDNIVYDRPAEWGPAPEPATWALMLLGMTGAGVALRRQRFGNRRRPGRA
jgi:hypothetical protein